MNGCLQINKKKINGTKIVSETEISSLKLQEINSKACDSFGIVKKFSSLFHICEKSSNQSSGVRPPSNITQFDQLKSVFANIDKNGDGFISKSELIASLGNSTTEEQVNKMLQEVDTNGDGCIDFIEFLKLNTSAADSAMISADLEDAFLTFDTDRNGYISPQELLIVMRSLGERCSLADCIKMIKGVDRDGDGLINFDEFKAMMTNTQL